MKLPVLARRMRLQVAFCVMTLVALAAGTPAVAQTLKSIQAPAKPLTLKSRGSFFVGGEAAEATTEELGLGPADVVIVNQMYVEFMVPAGKTRTPFVLIHGAGLSGKSYDTTPDGRMGWFEYFVRKSRPTYVVDQVGRARSGFNHITLNRRLLGTSPAAPVGPAAASSASRNAAFKFGNRIGVWTNFRFGPRFGETFPEQQFPVNAIAEFAKQAIPDLTPLVPSPNPTFKALAELAAELHGAILLGHSQSGPYPMDAALLDASGVRGLVAVEPGSCRSTYTDEQIARLATIPTLVIFGDNLGAATGISDLTWQTRMEGCRAYAARIQAAGGKVEIVNTPELGIRGNSHMLMQDRNSERIADIILKWADSHRI
jgi:pimeloyl-ACP methyl ester carboxylesterase